MTQQSTFARALGRDGIIRNLWELASRIYTQPQVLRGQHHSQPCSEPKDKMANERRLVVRLKGQYVCFRRKDVADTL
jgi:hypothetical protein